MSIRRYESMSRDKIYQAIAQCHATLTAVEKHQTYLASGNGLPTDELAGWRLQLSNSRLEEKLREHIRELEAELDYRDQRGANDEI
jgi:hypothetical protein